MVIARDSTFFYKGRSLDPRVIATKLNVGYVLRGSVRREGEDLKLNVSLVDGATGTHVWAEQYERKVGQIFEILSEMSRGVTGALAVTGTGLPDTGTKTVAPSAPSLRSRPSRRADGTCRARHPRCAPTS